MEGLEITPDAQGSERHNAGETTEQKAAAKEEKQHYRNAHSKGSIEYQRFAKRRGREEYGAHHKPADEGLADTGKPVEDWRIDLDPTGNGNTRYAREESGRKRHAQKD